MKRLPRKATREHTKIHNIRLVLKTIYDEGKISRADITRATRLTKTTVSDVVADLMAKGLVEEVGFGPSAGGKPPILLSVVGDSRHLIGIDLASDGFRGAAVNLRGEIRHRITLPLRGRDGDAALELVYALVGDLVAATNSTLLGIGIGTPGLMDTARGVVRQAVNLNWQNLPLRDLLQERFGLPVYVANDCQAAALAEYTFGKGRRTDTEDLVVIKIEHGVGAGVVLNGRLFYGDTSGAGEIGHLVLVYEGGERCRCGNVGCLETVTSERAIVRHAQELARRDPTVALLRFAPAPDKITIGTVCRAYQDGDEAVCRMIAEVGRYLGIAAASLVSVLSIRHVYIAGCVTCFGQGLLDVIKKEMLRHSLAVVADEVEVEMSSTGPDAVILGASAMVLTYELGLFPPFMGEVVEGVHLQS